MQDRVPPINVILTTKQSVNSVIKKGIYFARICVYALDIRICNALGKWCQPTFRLPFGGIGPPNRWVTVQIIDLNEHVRVFRYEDFVDLASVDVLNGGRKWENNITTCATPRSEYEELYDVNDASSVRSHYSRNRRVAATTLRNMSREQSWSSYRRKVSRHTASKKGKETSWSCVSSSLSSWASFSSFLSLSWASGWRESSCRTRERADEVVSVPATRKILKRHSKPPN